MYDSKLWISILQARTSFANEENQTNVRTIPEHPQVLQ